MRRKEMTDRLSRELHKLPLDIEVWLITSNPQWKSRMPHLSPECIRL